MVYPNTAKHLIWSKRLAKHVFTKDLRTLYYKSLQALKGRPSKFTLHHVRYKKMRALIYFGFTLERSLIFFVNVPQLNWRCKGKTKQRCDVKYKRIHVKFKWRIHLKKPKLRRRKRTLWRRGTARTVWLIPVHIPKWNI